MTIKMDELDGDNYRAIADPSLKMGVLEYKWSPDSSQIAFTSFDEEPEQSNKPVSDAKVFGKDSIARLRVVDSATRKVTTLFDETAHVAGLTWSPDGREIAFLTINALNMDEFFDGVWKIRVVNLETGQSSIICEFIGTMSSLTWRLGDGDGELLWFAMPKPASGNALYSVLVPASDQRNNSKLKAEHRAYGKDSCCEGLRSVNGGRDIVAYIQNGLKDEIHLLPQSLSRESAPRTLFCEEVDIGNRYDAHVTKASAMLVYVKQPAPGAFEEAFSLDCTTNPPTEVQLTSHNASFAAFQNCSARRSIHCTAPDGLALNGVFYLPGPAYSAPYPLVVNVHGGPYYRATHGTNIHFEWTEYLLSLGFAVLLPNYRGNAGRGAAIAEMALGNPDSGYEDVIAITKRVIQEEGAKGIVDKEKVAVAGYSYGGYMTNLIVTRQADRGNKDGFRFKCAVSGAGVSHIQSMALTTDAPHWICAMAGSAPWHIQDAQDLKQDNSNVLYRASPIHHVKSVDIPILMLHPEQDERVPKEQAVGFYRGMVDNGKKDLIELVMYPRDGHGFPVPWEKAHYEDMLTRLGDFMGKHLGRD